MAKTQIEDLPEEVMVEIFLRIPAKSVVKFRFLSKSWKSKLSTQQFIKLHLKLQVTRKTHQQNLLLISNSHSLLKITSPIENNAVSIKLELENTWSQVLGSCNGLVLLSNEQNDLYLVNPLTSQMVSVPDIVKSSSSFGFGYDTSTDDYKILGIPNCLSVDDASTDKSFYLYSLLMGVWFKLNTNVSVPRAYSDGVFVNGAIHFLAFGANKFIISAFDLANEVFYQIPYPSSVTNGLSTLCVLEDRLCLVDIDVEIWIMEEYGCVNSWKKLCNKEIFEGLQIFRPLSLLGEDEIVWWFVNGESWIVYNVKDGMVKPLVVDGIAIHYKIGGFYFDSLVSIA